ncbi:hypothetical protein HZC09_03715, partial [Candidatus Micrarchaeota archaeon]|nr:hypothetical protein [Candidatus Micrarchaeota archaeon]
TASPTPAPQKATLALSDCTTHVLAAGNNACPSGKVMAGMILGAARNNNVITCCSLTASGTKVTVNDAACSEQNILNNVPSRAGRAACNGDAFLTGVRLYMTTNQPTYAAIRCCPLSAAGSALVKSGDAVAVAPIQGTYTNCPTNYIGDGVEWVGEVGGNEDPQSDRIVCRETKTQTVPPQAQTQSAGSTTATTTISTTIGCGIESKTQKTIVQQCPNGCNPSKAECYSECRPAATKECTQNQLTGIQTCSAEGKWGECASDLSKLCRTEPKTTKFAGSTTNVRSKLETDRFLDLKTLEGFELEAPGKFSIKYATPVDVCNADIDSAVEWGDSWFSINSSKISESLTKPTKPASVTIRTTGLKEPALLYLNKPAKSYEEITATGAPCPTDRCLNVAYSPTSVSFDAAAFSSYAVAETAKQQTSIQKPVQTEMASGLVAKCPDKLIAAEEANVTVFYYENGFPKCIGGVTMSVTVGGEKTKTEYKDCKSGKHVFWVNTTLGGTYKVEAKGNGKTSECEFNSVKKKPTPTPETSEIIIALVALLAFAMARRKA